MKKKITKEEAEAYKIVQSLRGKESFKKRGKAAYSEMGKKGSKARWGKKKKDDLLRKK